jgi:glycosyltransferase involved in cell wall biosynthesis
MILIADKVQDFECVVKMYEIVFTKKQRMFDEWYVRNFLYNLQFFLQHVPKHNTQFIVLANEYIKFVYENGVKIHNFDFWSNPTYKNAGLELDNYLITEVTNKIQKFSKDECACSKNILIYTGFSDIEWNYTYIQNNALGGSEKAVSYISQCFSQCFSKDYTIYISGHVKNETIGNIQYINLNELTKLMEITPFHTVIVSRYISFYEMFKECSFYQSFIWAHDVLLLPYGSSLNETQILEKWDKYINGCICLTEWHKNVFSERYPILKDKITLINNGLDLKSFSIKNSNNNNNNNNESKYTNKIKNKFIYSSRPDRGLNVLLQLWSQILEIFPDAVLVVSSYGNFPSNPEEIILKNIIDSNDSITFLGKLSTDQLYVEMASSEYWLYPTHWPETSCITALEMLMSEVICLYYPVAGLVNTMDKYGIQVQPGKEIDTLVSLTDVKKETLRKNGREYAETCSWSNRCELWNKLLFFI